MVTTRITKLPGGRHLYLEEWMEERGVGDKELAKKLRVARETVTRYREQQHRLNPDKIAAIAKALDCEPAELWYPPGRLKQAVADITLKGLGRD